MRVTAGIQSADDLIFEKWLDKPPKFGEVAQLNAQSKDI
jgi:hypothetical protein